MEYLKTPSITDDLWRPFGNFVQESLDFCADHGFSVNFVAQKSVDRCAGYMSESKKRVVVATREGNWLATFVHEMGHVLQSIHETKWWKRYLAQPWNIFDPPSYENESEDTVKNMFWLSMKMEEECDKIAIKMINQYDLDPLGYIDRKEYIQASNCYHASYYYFWKHRCFYDPKHTPYRHPELIKDFSDKIIMQSNHKFRPRPIMDDFFSKYRIPL